MPDLLNIVHDEDIKMSRNMTLSFLSCLPVHFKSKFNIFLSSMNRRKLLKVLINLFGWRSDFYIDYFLHVLLILFFVECFNVRVFIVKKE